MKKTIVLKAMVLIAVLSLANQSFTLVDSTTDNQLPNMREGWQNPESSSCRQSIGEMDIDIEVGAQTTTPGQRVKESDIEEMEAGGDYETGW